MMLRVQNFPSAGSFEMLVTLIGSRLMMLDQDQTPQPPPQTTLRQARRGFINRRNRKPRPRVQRTQTSLQHHEQARPARARKLQQPSMQRPGQPQTNAPKLALAETSQVRLSGKRRAAGLLSPQAPQLPFTGFPPKRFRPLLSGMASQNSNSPAPATSARVRKAALYCRGSRR